jgi:ribosomal protein L16/L10AE
MQKKNLYNKYKKKSKKIISILNITTNIGFFYLRTLENIFLTKSNFESIRRLISRKVKKKVNFVFFKNSNKLPTFKKPLKVRMGSGKAAFDT